MWHVSISLQTAGAFLLGMEEMRERLAIDLLRGVGGDHEWWLEQGEQNRGVSHLRVPTTLTEQVLIPAGLVTMDAGSTGPLRPRTR